jgi:hypothetical protein
VRVSHAMVLFQSRAKDPALAVSSCESPGHRVPSSGLCRSQKPSLSIIYTVTDIPSSESVVLLLDLPSIHSIVLPLSGYESNLCSLEKIWEVQGR